ncbi:50S ribosomal protein L10 [Treponema sp. OMZ 840]|uniref:50S ribosomal protein L10 n=1 Tax=Treponema sp. OMZ 840 TaxID=244313 RepID=UPI003D8B1D17
MAILAKKIQPAKLDAVAATKTVFEGYKGFIFADYRGLTVEHITGLRRKLGEKNAKLKVVKNTYARVVFDEMKIENVAEYLTGPTAIALTAEDANEVAKILFDFAKEAPALKVKGAYIDDELYDAAKIEAFAKLPGRQQLLAMIASTINAPVQKLAATLLAYVEKRQAEEASGASAPKADAAPPAAETAAADAGPAEKTASAEPVKAEAAETSASSEQAASSEAAAPAETPSAE